MYASLSGISRRLHGSTSVRSLCSTFLVRSFSLSPHEPLHNRLRRVVVTGLGLVTPLAVGTQRTWEKLLQGECAVRSLAAEKEFAFLPCQVAARVPQKAKSSDPDMGAFHVDNWVPPNIKPTCSLFSQYAICAAKQALDDAGWKPTAVQHKERTGVAIGAGVGSMRDIYDSSLALNGIHSLSTLTSTLINRPRNAPSASSTMTSGYRRVSPYAIPRLLANSAAGHVSMAFGFYGPNHAVATACATGCHAIGDASRMIQFGDADVMVAGGSESCIDPLTMAMFCRCRSLSTKFNHSPSLASRPFARDRDGFVMGEGAGVVVLEERQHAIARGAHIYGEVLGYGLSSDAHHVTNPHPDGHGALLAIQAALRNADLKPSEIDYINAHATSTPLGDAAESRAMKTLLGGSRQCSISSTKGAVGHMLGAAGAVESIFCLLAIRDQIVPPTLNLDLGALEPEFTSNSLNYVANKPLRRKIRVALNNSFGFGGTNACLLFGKTD